MKRRQHLARIGFQRGNTPHNKGLSTEATEQEANSTPDYVRLPKDQYDMVYREKSELVREQELTANPPMQLRPKVCAPTKLEKAQAATNKHAEMETYRLFHPMKTANLWNEAISEHRKQFAKCNGSLVWDEAGEVKRGLAWIERLKCNKCDYVSRQHKLYEEVKTKQPGPKPATCNYGVQIGLAHTSISNTGFAKVILSTNTPAPSLSGMQANANKIGKVLVDTNEKSMKDIRKNLGNINRLRGLPTDTPINIEADCRYNNPIYSGIGKTPFQAATQVTHLIAENSTPRKQIIAVTNKNKLCQKCAIDNNTMKHQKTSTNAKSSKRKTHTAHVCSANIPVDATIGDERQWTSESLQQLEKDGITPNYITTDPDSKAFAGAQDVFLSSSSKAVNPPKHQIDTRHVNSNLTKLVKKIQFSKSMFPGKTQAEQQQSQKRFAIDLSSRCHAEHVTALNDSGGDTGKTITKLYTTKSAIAKCYTGDHSMCRRHSFVCSGRKTKNWLLQSSVLSDHFIIVPNQADHIKLMQAIDYRLGALPLTRLRHLLTTQKVEATNKAINNCVPRHMTFSKNFPGRVHAAIHAVNKGVGDAILTSCDAAKVSLTPGTRVTHGLLSLQNTDNKRKKYKVSKKSQLSRKAKRKKLFALHSELKSKTKTKETYKTAMCMPYSEHSYCKQPTQRHIDM